MFISALFVASYPGFLFGSMRPLPLWDSAHVPTLFLVSALLGSLGIVYLLPSIWMGLPWSLVFLQTFGLGLVVLELLLLLGLVLGSIFDVLLDFNILNPKKKKRNRTNND